MHLVQFIIQTSKCTTYCTLCICLVWVICNICRRYGELYGAIYTCGPQIWSWPLEKKFWHLVYADRFLRRFGRRYCPIFLFELLIKHNHCKSSHILDTFPLPVQLASTLNKFFCLEDGGSNLHEISDQSCHPRTHGIIIWNKPAR